jgi:hypothetical protein
MIVVWNYNAMWQHQKSVQILGPCNLMFSLHHSFNSECTISRAFQMIIQHWKGFPISHVVNVDFHCWSGKPTLFWKKKKKPSMWPDPMYVNNTVPKKIQFQEKYEKCIGYWMIFILRKCYSYILALINFTGLPEDNVRSLLPFGTSDLDKRRHIMRMIPLSSSNCRSQWRKRRGAVRGVG